MKKKNSHLPELLLGLVGVILIGTALYHILPDYLDNRKSADTYQTLEEKFLKIQEVDPDEAAADAMEAARETTKTDKTAAEKSGNTTTTENSTETPTEDTREEKKDWWFTDVTVAFDELKKENEEIIGWLRFDDAEDLHISYPVLYSGDDEKYLRSDIYGEEHIAGSIFLEGKNKPDFSDYYAVIYGHNMRDGSMFGDLDLYKETDFWKKHPYFTLYTETKAYRYEIFASQMASMSGNIFRIGYIPGKEYKDFIDELVEDSLIETGIHPKSSDHILTLSTCTGNGYDSRMTVHAVCIDEQTTDPEKLL